jgi:hypothetical protein
MRNSGSISHRLARTQFSVNTANEQISFEGVSYDVGNMS